MQFSIDIKDNQIFEYIYTFQNDVGNNHVFTINSNGKPVDLDSYSAVFRMDKTDNTYVLNTCEKKDNQVIITETEQMTVYAGVHDFQITIGDKDGNILTSIPGKYVVMPTPGLSSGLTSKDESDILHFLIMGLGLLKSQIKFLNDNHSLYLEVGDTIDKNILSFESVDGDSGFWNNTEKIVGGDTTEKIFNKISSNLHNLRYLKRLYDTFYCGYDSSIEDIKMDIEKYKYSSTPNLINLDDVEFSKGGITVKADSTTGQISINGICESTINQKFIMGITEHTEPFELAGSRFKDIETYMMLALSGYYSFSDSLGRNIVKSTVCWFGYDSNGILHYEPLQFETAFGMIEHEYKCLTRYGASQCLNISEEELKLGFILELDIEPGDIYSLIISPMLSLIPIDSSKDFKPYS